MSDSTQWIQEPHKRYRPASIDNFAHRIKRNIFRKRLHYELSEVKNRINQLENSIKNYISTKNESKINTKPTKINIKQSKEFIAHVITSNMSNIEMKKRLNDLEKRLKITELTTDDITKQISETRGYLNQLKANISQAEKEPEKNNTAGDMQKDGIKKLPPSKDLQAFQKYLKDIGEMTREDFQDLGNQKNDFIASCTWQGTTCDPR